jgi:hypothetical protein
LQRMSFQTTIAASTAATAVTSAPHSLPCQTALTSIQHSRWPADTTGGSTTLSLDDQHTPLPCLLVCAHKDRSLSAQNPTTNCGNPHSPAFLVTITHARTHSHAPAPPPACTRVTPGERPYCRLQSHRQHASLSCAACAVRSLLPQGTRPLCLVQHTAALR